MESQLTRASTEAMPKLEAALDLSRAAERLSTRRCRRGTEGARGLVRLCNHRLNGLTAKIACSAFSTIRKLRGFINEGHPIHILGGLEKVAS